MDDALIISLDNLASYNEGIALAIKEVLDKKANAQHLHSGADTQVNFVEGGQTIKITLQSALDKLATNIAKGTKYTISNSGLTITLSGDDGTTQTIVLPDESTTKVIPVGISAGYLSAGDTIPEHTTFEEFLSMMFDKELGWSVVNPNVRLDLSRVVLDTEPENDFYEVGTVLDENMTGEIYGAQLIAEHDWTDPRDIDIPTMSESLQRNGETVESGRYTLPLGSTIYKINTSWAKQTVSAETNKGHNRDYSFQPGSQENEVIYNTAYRAFYGEVEDIDAIDLDTLNNPLMLGQTVDRLDCGANKYLVIIVPDGYVPVVYDAMGAAPVLLNSDKTIENCGKSQILYRIFYIHSAVDITYTNIQFESHEN